MENSFYTQVELQKLGFKKFGEQVLISRFARFYGISEMELGSHVRIDDFCILSGNIRIGNFVHISAHTVLYGKSGIVLEDFTGLSCRCTVYSAGDDFSGKFMIGPMVPDELTHVTGGCVYIRKYAQLGAGCVVLPSVTIGEGVAVGSMSLINKNLEAWYIYYGIPAKQSKPRSKKMLLMAGKAATAIQKD